MNNNDLLRRLRYNFEISDPKMVAIFRLADYETTVGQINAWMKKEEDPAFRVLDDLELAVFLNGFINDKRGKREGPPLPPEKFLNNNIILRKLKIALNLKDTDMLEILELVDMKISKHELSAFFRNPKQNQYRRCEDQILRKFVHGMQLKYRGKNK